MPDGRISEEVSIKEQDLAGIFDAQVDDMLGSRYSLAQIKDLVAYAIPGPLRIDKSSGSCPAFVAANLLSNVAVRFSLSQYTSCGFIYKTLPGGSASGPARFISPLNRPPGGN